MPSRRQNQLRSFRERKRSYLSPIDLSFHAFKFHPTRQFQTGYSLILHRLRIEPLQFLGRDDAMSTKKPSPGGAARAFYLAVQGQQIFSITLVFDR